MPFFLPLCDHFVHFQGLNGGNLFCYFAMIWLVFLVLIVLRISSTLRFYLFTFNDGSKPT